MIDTKNNKVGIFMAISKNWPKEKREAYLKSLKENRERVCVITKRTGKQENQPSNDVDK